MCSNFQAIFWELNGATIERNLKKVKDNGLLKNEIKKLEKLRGWKVHNYVINENEHDMKHGYIHLSCDMITPWGKVFPNSATLVVCLFDRRSSKAYDYMPGVWGK